MELNIPDLATKIPTERDAYLLLEEWRWHGEPVCPHCGSVNKHYPITPRDGVAKTNRGTETARREWKCKDCRKKFTVLTNTIMHGTHIPIRTWVFVIFELCASKNGIAAREIERRYDLAPKSAWFMLHRIREAMANGPGAELFSGVVVADEAWIGGEPRFRHAKNRRAPKSGATDKTPILSLINTVTGEVRSKVVTDVGRDTLRSAIAEHVDIPLTTLHTDASPSYKRMASEFAGHEFVNHKAGEYVRDGVSTNKLENYFSQLKRSIDGTHHNVSRPHLGRYLAEFDFRFTTHGIPDSERVSVFMDRVVGRRLSYYHSS
ncbi:MAG: IS1595 family transposase [Acidimicrobiales bacterium]